MPQAHGASPIVEFGDDLGLLSQVIITGKKVGAGRALYSRLAHDEAFFRRVVDLAEPKDGNAPSVRFASLKTARKILGADKVYTGARVAKKWSVELGADVPVRYTDADLVEAARENAAGTADWRVVRVLGLWSPRELHARFGTDPKSQPCFYKNSTWWLGKSEDKWATRKPTPGYYLFDFSGKWGSMSWDAQEVQITASGPDFERADEAALTEAVFTIFQLTGERLLENWYHWGPTLDSDGDRVYVGNFDRGGLDVGRDHPGCSGGNLRVVRSRKFRS